MIVYSLLGSYSEDAGNFCRYPHTDGYSFTVADLVPGQELDSVSHLMTILIYQSDVVLIEIFFKCRNFELYTFSDCFFQKINISDRTFIFVEEFEIILILRKCLL